MDDEELVALARQARAQAYAPYSHFPVGAALEAEDGRVFLAANVENASYGLTICAERAAAFKAVSEGARRFKRVAVVADTPGPTTPCGACRQVLNEFGPSLIVVMANLGAARQTLPLAELLPRAFGPENLSPRPPPSGYPARRGAGES